MKGLEQAAENQKDLAMSILDSCEDDLAQAVSDLVKVSYMAGAKYAADNVWQKADGDYLPEIDREVIALQKCASGYKVVYAHRPNQKAYVKIDGKKYYPICYDKGGWNLENIVYWLDCSLPNENK